MSTGGQNVTKAFPFSDRHLILASSSPRRKYLLSLIHLSHIVAEPKIDEDEHRYEGGAGGGGGMGEEGGRQGEPAREDPVRHVLRLSRLKAHSVKNDFDSGYILGADTIVVVDDEILGKPRNEAEARGMLSRLAGRPHDVYTGLTLVDAATGNETQGYEMSTVDIRPMTETEIGAYIATGEPMDKAGSYGIQGYGAAIVERVNGCYFNVVGLPIVRLLHLVRELDGICGGS